jgi:RNA-directed DNA polymerase
MKRHGNLFEKIVDIDNLRLAFKKAKKAKAWMKSVKAFEEDFENNLLKIQESLINKTFTTSPYKTKYAYYPKFREIFVVPFAPDRIVQHALMSVVEPIWDKILVDNSTSCRTGKGVESAFKLAAKYINTNKYYLKCDISKFYPSIDHDILYSIIERKIKCKDTLWLLKDIVYSFGRQFDTDKNSPIGNYTSQWFGNLYMDLVDRLATQELKVDYIRYCDDFIFFSDDKKLLNEVKKMLPDYLMEHRKLRLSKCELCPSSVGLDFIGYRFFPKGYILLRKRVAKVMKRRLLRIQRKLDRGGNLLNRRTRSSVASAEGLLRRCNSHNFKKAVNFSSLLKRVKIKVRKHKRK